MRRALPLTLILALACGTLPGDDATGDGLREVAPCRVTGCSGQVCSDRDLLTTCEWLPEYACYRTARCEPQADRTCGWTRTPEIVACIEEARRR